MASDSLEARVGLATESGRRPSNDDYVATCHGNGAVLRDTLAVMGDGMGGGVNGRLAAETTVRGFIDGYLSLPPTLGIDRAAAARVGGHEPLGTRPGATRPDAGADGDHRSPR